LLNKFKCPLSLGSIDPLFQPRMSRASIVYVAQF
jgi:hypothetical protein